ncbi:MULTISPECIES: type II toxin-antitoxin system VapC family toxin [Streptomyces]|uniref:Ribonuclease VapC n=1 Tax=Streptomyces sp. SID7499 TaxID=2706086 RepID=A0A6G3WHQ5_9ACTN|nr:MULTISPECIES: PIN domain-containing protein [unclassified Streptomyces]NDZ59807.1 PIN domain-containing protein [Streptomyces anulatus]NEE04992.1 PIN domain-containing protein [Streptomyces sp. SID7499]OLO32766.1 VapC toxin family PIN domain ribonuclease [Streptomyces sp. MNU77]OWA21999.1 PIN domain nuclease [Streptomyces sp. CS057]
MIVVADTSGLLALYNSSDPAHLAARKVVDQCGLLVASPLVLTEVHYVASARGGRRVADHILRSISKQVRGARLVLVLPTAEILDTALAVRARYATLNLDLVDAVNVALAAEYDTDAVLTRDIRDFRTLRPLAGRYAHFRILPDDF